MNPHETPMIRRYWEGGHDGEGDSLDPQGFRDLFAADRVLNGIGDVVAQQSFQGTQLSGLIVYLADFLPDIHRALKKITVSGDVVCIQLTIHGTFLGALQTPVGPIEPTGAKIAFPTADFWYLRDGKVEVFDCHIAFTTLFAQLGVARASSCPGGRREAGCTSWAPGQSRAPPGLRPAAAGQRPSASAAQPRRAATIRHQATLRTTVSAQLRLPGRPNHQVTAPRRQELPNPVLSQVIQHPPAAGPRPGGGTRARTRPGARGN